MAAAVATAAAATVAVAVAVVMAAAMVGPYVGRSIAVVFVCSIEVVITDLSDLLQSSCGCPCLLGNNLGVVIGAVGFMFAHPKLFISSGVRSSYAG